VVGLAGCGGSSNNQSADQSSNTSTETQSDSAADSADEESESTTDSIQNTKIIIKNMTYGFSGLTARLQVENTLEDPQNSKRVQVQVTAYSDGEEIGTNLAYTTFQYNDTVELSLENISKSSDNTLSDVTKFTISGRVTGVSDSLSIVHEFTNEELQAKIEETGN
jgi:hypothetical protein